MSSGDASPPAPAAVMAAKVEPASAPSPPAPAPAAPGPADAQAVAVVSAPPPPPAGKGDAAPAAAVDPDDVINAPQLNFLQCYVRFLYFGATAFGGPMAQINNYKDQLVLKEKWISVAKFNRVFAVYQVLPGPEATQLACYFGLITGGRLNAIAGGLGFITPGFLLMLAFSAYYEYNGVSNPVFQSIFVALQPAVCSMVFRAAHKISDAAFKDADTKAPSLDLQLIGALGALENVLGVNYFIIKLHAGLLNVLLKRKMRWTALAFALAVVAVFAGVIAGVGPMDKLVPLGVGAAKNLGNTYGGHVVVGLIAGLVTFGGAYSAIPFMRYECVDSGRWVGNQVFLDALAVCALLPTPLVMFSTMIGYNAGAAAGLSKVGGSVLMTLGMFLPAFSFPVLGHAFFERVAAQRGDVAYFLDGMTASVVGLVLVTGCQLLRTAIRPGYPVDAIIFVGSFYAQYDLAGMFGAWTPVTIIIAVGMLGFVVFY